MYPVEIYYLKDPCRNYVQKCLEVVGLIHKYEPPSGDILVFLTSLEDINKFLEMFMEMVKGEDKKKN